MGDGDEPDDYGEGEHERLEECAYDVAVEDFHGLPFHCPFHEGQAESRDDDVGHPQCEPRGHETVSGEHFADHHEGVVDDKYGEE